jgi:outer membrane protein
MNRLWPYALVILGLTAGGASGPASFAGVASPPPASGRTSSADAPPGEVPPGTVASETLASRETLPAETLPAGASAAGTSPSEAPSGEVSAVPAAAEPDSAVQSTPDSEARSITLEEALELARTNAPSLIQAAGEVRSSNAALRSAYGSFLPSLSVSAGASRRIPSPGGGTRIENGEVILLPSQPWTYSAGFGTSLTLFGGGSRLFAVRQARANANAAQVSELAQRYELDLSVKQAYFAVLAAREAETAALAQIKQAEEQLHAATLRLHAGNATTSDSLRSDIELRNAQLALFEARNGIHVGNVSLSRAIGVSELVTATGEPPVMESVPLDEAGLAALLEEAPTVKEAEAAVKAARAAKNIAWSDYLPSLSASFSEGGGASGRDPFFGPGELQYTGSLRLSLSLPIFNQFRREESVVRADVALENAEAKLRDARLAAREELASALGDFRLAAQRVETQAATVTASEEDLRVQRQRYEVGSGTLLDVLTSQTQLNTARQALIRARYDQRIARARLDALLGREL